MENEGFKENLEKRKLMLHLHCTTLIVHQITNYDNDPQPAFSYKKEDL